MPHFRGDGHYRPRPDKYKHKKPKSRNPWSPNYDDSPQEETGYFSQPQDYSQGYVNPYVNAPDAPVFDTSSAQDNAGNLQDFMDSNKPPHLQNRWKQQPERFTFSQPIEKCSCEPKQEAFEFDINEKVPYMYGKAYHGEKSVVYANTERPIWEKKAAEGRKLFNTYADHPKDIVEGEINFRDYSEKYRKALCDSINKLSNIIIEAKNQNHPYDLYQKMLSELQQSKAEFEFIIDIIDSEGITIKVKKGSGGATTFDQYKAYKIIAMEVIGNRVKGEDNFLMSNFIHEMKHVYSFLSGEEAIYGKNTATETHDVYDEIIAYISEKCYEYTRGDMNYDNMKQLYDRNVLDVWNNITWKDFESREDRRVRKEKDNTSKLSENERKYDDGELMEGKYATAYARAKFNLNIPRRITLESSFQEAFDAKPLKYNNISFKRYKKYLKKDENNIWVPKEPYRSLTIRTILQDINKREDYVIMRPKKELSPQYFEKKCQ